MKKITTMTLCLAMAAVFSASGCKEPTDSFVPAITIAVNETGIITYEAEEDEAWTLYRGETKLIEIESGEDISALVTANVETYTVRNESGKSNGVKIYKPQTVTDFSVNGTYVYFTAESGVRYDLLINGEKKGETTSGTNIRAHLLEGPWEICVSVDGGTEGDTVRLQSKSNAVRINASGDNDVEYNPDWL